MHEFLSLRQLGSTAKTSPQPVREPIHERILFAGGNEGILGLQIAKVDDCVHRLKLIRDFPYLFFHRLEFLFVCMQIIIFFVSLLEDLFFLLNCFDGFIIANEFAKVPVVIVDYFHLVGPPIESIEMGF